MNINILKPETGYSVQPKICQWSGSEQYISCSYDYSVQQDDKNVSTIALVLFDVSKKQYIYIYKNPILFEMRRSPGSAQSTLKQIDFGFSFNELSTVLYYDYDNSIYKVDNLQEMSQSNFTIEPRIAKLENMHPCRMITYDNSAIYCSVRAEEIGKTIQDQDNPLIEGREFFIIKQNINQKSPQDYQILNLAPLRDANQLTVLSDTHIDFDGTIINMKTGRIVKDAPTFGLGGEPETRAIRYYGDQ